MKKPFVLIFLVLLVLIQYRLWFGEDGLAQALHMQSTIHKHKARSNQLKTQNTQLMNNITALKYSTTAIENQARNDLGMIKNGETFYQIIR